MKEIKKTLKRGGWVSLRDRGRGSTEDAKGRHDYLNCSTTSLHKTSIVLLLNCNFIAQIASGLSSFHTPLPGTKLVYKNPGARGPELTRLFILYQSPSQLYCQKVSQITKSSSRISFIFILFSSREQ